MTQLHRTTRDQLAAVEEQIRQLREQRARAVKVFDAAKAAPGETSEDASVANDAPRRPGTP
jgi:hypothetical protein